MKFHFNTAPSCFTFLILSISYRYSPIIDQEHTIQICRSERVKYIHIYFYYIMCRIMSFELFFFISVGQSK